jgi:dTDP-4-dehydrorhamnose reductase
MKTKQKILLTGASGFLGSNFCQIYGDQYDIHAIWHSHPIEFLKVKAHKVDITDQDQVLKLFDTIKPGAVIHLAAGSDPNYCQLHPEESEKVNVEASEFIAEACGKKNISLLFASTDLVFDGKSAPYQETDLPCPINTYGFHKSIAEQSVLDIFPSATICRLPLMFGPAPLYSGNTCKTGIGEPSAIIPTRQNTSFLQPMLKKLMAGEKVSLFTDEYRTVASARDVCQGLFSCLDQPGEIFHLGGDERISRYGFGEIVCEVFGFDKALLVKSKQKDYKMAAPRPKDVSLSSKKANALNWQPGSISEELRFIKNTLA